MKEDEIKQDNTKVQKPIISKPIKMSDSAYLKKLYEVSKENQAFIYDKDKYDTYYNLLKLYNSHPFGFGIQGHQTNYDASTSKGQSLIMSNFINTSNNVRNFYDTTGLLLSGGTQLGLYPLSKGRRTVGHISDLNILPKIGEGAESIVYHYRPGKIIKVSLRGTGEINHVNLFPGMVKSKVKGFVRDGKKRYTIFTQDKLRRIKDSDFSKYVLKLDKEMFKNGYKPVSDENIGYRAYTNGKYVIDDISPDNIGLTLFGKPKIFDSEIWTVPLWIEQGFHLKNGGKIK